MHISDIIMITNYSFLPIFFGYNKFYVQFYYDTVKEIE